MASNSSTTYSVSSSPFFSPSPLSLLSALTLLQALLRFLFYSRVSHHPFSTMPPQRNESAFLHAPLATPIADTIVIFDFDCTIIEFDSDPWVVDHLGATELMDSLRTYLPWNEMMDAMMAALHAQGKNIEDIEETLKMAPLEAEKAEAIKAAYELGCEIRIVSDANTFFIKTILEAHNLDTYFMHIHTNPACVDEKGALHILPFHPKSTAPHGCPLCPPNMCKGKILDSILASLQAEGKKMRIIYLGDGCGDYCPSLRLRVGDYVLPREGYPLDELLHENAMQVKAEVKRWKTARDMAVLLLECLKSENQD